LLEKSGSTTTKMDEHVGTFQRITGKVLTDLGGLAGQFDNHGRLLAAAVELVDKSNRRTEDSIQERSTALDALVAALDARTNDLDERLKRFSSLLDESLEAATGRAREVARVVADSSAASTRNIAEQYDVVRMNAEQERKQTGDAMRQIYEQATGDAHAMLRDSAERFAELVQGVKQMANEMQRELDITRQDLRRGVFELPQETAEGAAQMRRVIVDQIEALAELNRIVARHGRGLDTAEPGRRAPPPPRPPPRGEPRPAGGRGGRGRGGARGHSGGPEAAPPARPTMRPDRSGPGPAGPGAQRAEGPALAPPQGGGTGGRGSSG